MWSAAEKAYNAVRASLVLPRVGWEEVRRLIPAGKWSRVIARATEREIRLRRRVESVERLRLLQQEWRAKYGRLPDSAEEIRRMREERDTEIAGLR